MAESRAAEFHAVRVNTTRSALTLGRLNLTHHPGLAPVTRTPLACSVTALLYILYSRRPDDMTSGGAGVDAASGPVR